MSVDKKVPKIRFKGFSEKWKKKELGKDVADIIGGGTPSTLISEFWDGDIDWYSPTEIGSRVYAEGSHKKITLLGLKSSSAKILPAGKTVLFTSRAGIGDMAILTKPGATNQGFQSFIVKEGFSPYFIYSVGKQIKEFALKHASGSTFLEISGKQLGRMKILMPILEEQTTIGNYFQKLDTLINQHQKKHDKLCNIKQAMLEKMFPKQGETIPEIRFRGFCEKWVEKKLGDICDVRDGTHSSPQYHQNGFPLVTSKNVKNGYINYDDVQFISKNDFDEINKRSKVDINDILMGMIGTIGNIALVREAANFAIKNVALIKDKKIIDFLYIYYFLQSPMIIQFLDDSASGGTQKFISLSNVRCLLTYLPRRKEQTLVGNFFQKLDNLINQHHQQITKLKNIKQACLSKMFV